MDPKQLRKDLVGMEWLPKNSSLMNWEEIYQKGEVFWNKGEPSPPMKQYLERNAVRGRTLVPGCGHGHEVALAVAHGLDATGLEIAPTGVAEARALYPQHAERFVVGDLFNPPVEMHGAYDVVLEHTCMSGLHPTLRADYRRGIDLTLRRGGLLIGVWFINPDLDPGEDGPPYPFSVDELTAFFADDYEIVDDYVPDLAFRGRKGRERLRVLRRRG